MKSLYVVMAFVAGWLLAQVSKLVVATTKTRGRMKPKDVVYYLTKSGGMPSGHTASFLAVALTIGFLEGFDSAVFALAVAMTVIIIYDATNVRYAVGQQGKLLNKIAENDGLKSTKPIKVVEGHTIPEVCAGAILGVLVAFTVKAIFGF